MAFFIAPDSACYTVIPHCLRHLLLVSLEEAQGWSEATFSAASGSAKRAWGTEMQSYGRSSKTNHQHGGFHDALLPIIVCNEIWDVQMYDFIHFFQLWILRFMMTPLGHPECFVRSGLDEWAIPGGWLQESMENPLQLVIRYRHLQSLWVERTVHNSKFKHMQPRLLEEYPLEDI